MSEFVSSAVASKTQQQLRTERYFALQGYNSAGGSVCVWNLSLILNEKHRPRVFEDRVLRIFGPWRDEVTGECTQLDNKELRDLHSLPSIIRMIKSRWMAWAGHVARMGEKKDTHRLLVGKPEGKRVLGIPWRRWVDNTDNTEMNLGEIGWGGVYWNGLAPDSDKWRVLVNAIMNLRVR
jgi:hypothetical protein